MVDDGEEYDAYNLSEFSAADFMYIDDKARQHADNASTSGARTPLVVTSESGGPQVAVALELATDESVVVKAAAGPSGSAEVEVVDTAEGLGDPLRRRAERKDIYRSRYKVDSRSPFEKYRPRGTLSVTDLVGPAWCEVQFDYGLRQGRSLAVADRPESFVSAEGKVIKVEKKVAQTNEKVQGRGRSVHKALEREIYPEQVTVSIKTKEEHWAARLINMLSCLSSLEKIGVGREMPVFGFVQDQVIIGIIDEISLKPVSEIEASNSHKRQTPTLAPGTPKKSKKPRTSSPSQPELATFFPSPSKGKSRKSASPPSCSAEKELSILDTKTRRSNSLPSDDDAYSSRMQLMLYHHLLTALLAPTFPFHTFWDRIGVDPFTEFSDAFLLQSGLAVQSPGMAVQKYLSTLDDLTNYWRTTVCSMHLRGLSPTLEIVYRTQPKRSINDHFAEAGREARDLARATASSIRESDHDPDLQRAIAESLRDMIPVTDADVGENAQASATEQKTHVSWYAPEGVKEQGSEAMGSAWPSEVPSIPQEARSSSDQGHSPGPRIIGRKRFAFDADAMNAHVENVMQWWRGERIPQGVDIEHVHRCWSCEYRDGCEWREMKAKEAQDNTIWSHDQSN